MSDIVNVKVASSNFKKELRKKGWRSNSPSHYYKFISKGAGKNKVHYACRLFLENQHREKITQVTEMRWHKDTRTSSWLEGVKNPLQSIPSNIYNKIREELAKIIQTNKI